MALETLEKYHLESDAYRLASQFNLEKFLPIQGLEPREIRDTLALFSKDIASGEQLIGNSFTPWGDDPSAPYGAPTRYSDGSWPVCYCALDLDTAVAEVNFHLAEDARPLDGSSRRYLKSLVLVRLDGQSYDLVPKLSEWPELVSNDYLFCTDLGREAETQRADIFVAPSARRNGGINFPVFQRTAIVGISMQSQIVLRIGSDPIEFWIEEVAE